MKTIIDLILIAIIIICGWTGYKKGLIMGIGGILVIIVSIYGAHLLSQTFSYEALPVMRPFAAGYLEGRLSDKPDKPGILTELGIFTDSRSLEDYLKDNPEEARRIATATYMRFGITQNTSEKMAGLAVDHYTQKGGNFPAAMTEILCNRIAYVICFALAFLIIVIVLTVIGNLSNLSFKIPNLDMISDISGAALGVITGIMFCMILVWALKYTGMFIGGETLSKTWIAKMFLSGDALTKVLGY